MRSRGALAQYEATLVLVVISLSLASVVYEGLRGSEPSPRPLFVDSVTGLGGSPAIVRVLINSSLPATVTSLELDAARSGSGVLGFNGSGYSTVGLLCFPGLTTFFSVLASRRGALEVATDGRPWIAGAWTASANVSAGWQELMIRGGTSCSVTLPGGETLGARWNSSSQVVSSIPSAGALSGTVFTFYVPAGAGRHTLLLTTTGGFEDVAV